MKKQKKSVLSKKTGPVLPSSENIKNKESFPVNHKAGLLLSLIAFLLYSNTIGYGYVLHDSAVIVENLFVQKGLIGIPELLKTEFWHFNKLELGYYRPLSLISFAAEHQFFGNNPHVSHFINVLLFAFSGYMLFILLNKIFNRYNFLFPFAIALLFISHPIHTEVIANIKNRDELLSFLNVLLMTWFAVKYAGSKKTIHLLLSLFFFYLGLLSKETSVMGLLLVPVVLFFQYDIPVTSALKKTIPYLFILILFLVQKKILLGTFSSEVPDDIINYPYNRLSVRLAMAFYFFAFGLKLLFVPQPLRYTYSYNQVPGIDFSSPVAWLSLLLIVCGLAAILKYYKTKSPVILGLIILYINMLPLITFTVLRGGIFAERFLFFSSLGFSIGLIAGFNVLLKMDLTLKTISIKNFILSKAAFFLLITAAVVLYSIKTFSRNQAWKDEITLYSTDIKTGENSVQNLGHYGTEMLKRALIEKDSVRKIEYAAASLKTFQKAVKIHPAFGEIYSQLGILYHEIYTDPDSAIYYFDLAVKIMPAHPFLYYHLGLAYQEKGNYFAASYFFNEALRVSPGYPKAIAARDNIKNKAGLDIHENPLITSFDTTTAVKNSAYYYDLGNHYASRGNYQLAALQYSKSILLDSAMEDSYINLANCYGMMKNYDQYIRISELLLRRNPKNVQALENLAETYKIIGNKEKAEEYIKKANALKK